MSFVLDHLTRPRIEEIEESAVSNDSFKAAAAGDRALLHHDLRQRIKGPQIQTSENNKLGDDLQNDCESKPICLTRFETSRLHPLLAQTKTVKQVQRALPWGRFPSGTPLKDSLALTLVESWSNHIPKMSPFTKAMSHWTNQPTKQATT